jgi:Leu/Phe-tRNA-protein transferase
MSKRSIKEVPLELSPRVLLAAYASGAFPMPDPDEESDILWFAPDPRALLPLDERFHISRRLGRTLRQGRFLCTIDRDFAGVMRACARREEGTWINRDFLNAYGRLHELGIAHSVEAWLRPEDTGLFSRCRACDDRSTGIMPVSHMGVPPMSSSSSSEARPPTSPSPYPLPSRARGEEETPSPYPPPSRGRGEEAAAPAVCWAGDDFRPTELVGGVYGLALGGAFFAESMFHTATDAGKVALVHLVTHLRRRGFVLCDVQWTTPNLARLGAFEIAGIDYLALLAQAIGCGARF